MTGTSAPTRRPAPISVRRFLTLHTGMSRNAAMQAYQAGHVRVELPQGVSCTHAHMGAKSMICPDTDKIFLHDRRVGERPAPPPRYYAFHKPFGVITDVLRARGFHEGQRTLQEFMTQLSPGVFPVGRLDKETTGLLLFTSDGDLSHVLLRPGVCRKEYELTVKGTVSLDDARIQHLVSGVELTDGPAKALSVVLGPAQDVPDHTKLRLVIDVGRKRIVRRMARGVGFRLKHLHRVAVGAVRMASDHPPGEFRELTHSQVQQLWASFGGRQEWDTLMMHVLAHKTVDFRCTRLRRWMHDSGWAHLLHHDQRRSHLLRNKFTADDLVDVPVLDDSFPWLECVQEPSS